MTGVGVMSKVSRRGLLAGAAAPAGTVHCASLMHPTLPPASAEPDELAARAAGWIAGHEQLNVMQLRWQEFEGLLFDKARRMGMDCELACGSNLPEAQAMRAINEDIDETRRQLDAAAGEIRLTPATTIAGALAKIELGLRVQGPFDWQDHALELLEDGIAELRGLVR
jgi:hypothetical protein